MAGVTGRRLRLTTSRTPSYWRGGVAIGSTSAPTYLERDSVSSGQLLEIVCDPNIALAFEEEDGTIAVFSEEDRAEFEAGLLQVIEADGPDRTLGAEQPDASGPPAPVGHTDTAEPQGDGSAPEGGNADAEASQVTGPDASADASAGSAADAGNTEPSQPVAAEPAPVENAPAPAEPASKGAGKPKTVKAKS